MARQETKGRKTAIDRVETPRAQAARAKTLTLDVGLYESWLEDDDLSEDQKREFLAALWSIIVAFVDLGYGIHPLQQGCGQGAPGFDPATLPQIDMVDCENTGVTKSFESATGGKTLPTAGQEDS